MQLMVDLYLYSSDGSGEKQQAAQQFVQLAQDSDILIEQVIESVMRLYWSNQGKLDEKQHALQLLVYLAQRPTLSVEQIIQCAQQFYQASQKYTNNVSLREERLINDKLGQLTRSSLSFERTIQAIHSIYQEYTTTSMAKNLEDMLLARYAQRSDISVKQTLQMAQTIYQDRTGIPIERKLAAKLLMYYTQRSDVPIELVIQIAQTVYEEGYRTLEEKLLLISMLLQLTRHPDLSVEQAIQFAQFINSRMDRPFREIVQPIIGLLFVDIAQRPGLSADQTILTAQSLWQFSRNRPERDLARQLLLTVAHDQMFPTEQRLQAVTVLFEIPVSPPELAQVVRLIVTLLNKQEAREYLDTHCKAPISTIALSNISALVELAQQELLPAKIRDWAYMRLRYMVPKFNELDDIDN